MAKGLRRSVTVLVVLGLGFLGAQVASERVTGSSPEPAKVLQFNRMIGVPVGFTSPSEPIRGVPGGGLPWVIRSGKGELRTDGDLRVKVEGLVFDPEDPEVIARGLAGINTVPFFKAIVSCLTLDADGNQKVVNVETGLFEADRNGDAFIRETVELPNPLIAPIVFVTSPRGMWFASTGF